MAIEVFTEQFEFEHGHLPRGRGNWGFHFCRGGAMTREAEFAPGEMTFSEARRWAISQARATGCDAVSVAS